MIWNCCNMAENEGKRKAEESVIEKIYKKIRKLEDHYYSLKKSAATTTKADETHGKEAEKGIDMSQLFESDGPNTESEKHDNSGSEHESSDLEISEVAIDKEALQILGEDPALGAPKEFVIHSDLASRWKAWIIAGLKKETRAELLECYSREGNCPLETPVLNPENLVFFLWLETWSTILTSKLNPELASSLNETAVKRDKHFVDSQCLIGSAMSALGSAITLLLNEKKEGVDRNELLKLMCDAGKLLADLHHKESVARKAYIMPGLDKKAKAILGKIETDGVDLSKKLKSAKAVEKAGLDLKLQPAKALQPKTPFKKNNPVNWKSPSARFQRDHQVGSSQRGPSTYKSKKGRAQQENQRPDQTQARDEKSSTGRK